MLPKKQAKVESCEKVEQKKKKIIKDKTFVLKNKKGAKQQKFIKAVTHQVKFGQQKPRQTAQSEAEKKKKTKGRWQEERIAWTKWASQNCSYCSKISKVLLTPNLCVHSSSKDSALKETSVSSPMTSLWRQKVRSEVFTLIQELKNFKKMEKWDEKKTEEVVYKKHGEAETID